MFTVLVRFVLMPLDIKSRKGMRKMSQIQPEINRLQKKYANDKAKLQQKQSELFRKEHYNPLSGCLPMLLQWPVMIAMFAAMRNMANDLLVQQVISFLAGQEPVYDSFFWIKNVWMPDSPFSALVPTTAELSGLTYDVWQKSMKQMLDNPSLAPILQDAMANCPSLQQLMDLTADTAKAQFSGISTTIIATMTGMPLYEAAIEPVQGWTINMFIVTLTLYKEYNGLLILPVLAVVTQLVQFKLNPQQAQAQTQPAANGKPNGMGNFMKYFFPILTAWFCLVSNAGFALYWVTSNVVAGLQTVALNKYFDSLDKKAALAKGETGEGFVK